MTSLKGAYTVKVTQSGVEKTHASKPTFRSANKLAFTLLRDGYRGISIYNAAGELTAKIRNPGEVPA